MLLMGYLNISEISEHYVYSFTEEQFLKDSDATVKFGWNQDLEQDEKEKIMRDIEKEIGYIQNSKGTEVLTKRRKLIKNEKIDNEAEIIMKK